MKITDAVHEFILYKQSLGMTYKNRALKLTAFARLAGPVEIDGISPETVRRFLDAGRPVTAEQWFHRPCTLPVPNELPPSRQPLRDNPRSSHRRQVIGVGAPSPMCVRKRKDQRPQCQCTEN